ncbi:MAG: sigma-70 family RNA polymerase sigma factor [Planctomycetota bacterium]
MQIHQAARTAFLRFRDRGDPAALAQVFDLVAQELLLVASHFATQGVDAEELLQETFVRAIHGAHTYDPARPLEPWLVGILANVARSSARRARRLGPAADEGEVPAPNADPVERASAEEFVAALHAQLQRIPLPLREVLTLNLVHGMTPTEIAHAMGRPVGTVKSWVHRGVRQLRQLLPAGFAVMLAAFARAGTALPLVRAQVVGAAEAAVGLTAAAAWAPGAIAPGPVANGAAARVVARSGWRAGLTAAAGLALVGGAVWLTVGGTTGPAAPGAEVAPVGGAAVVAGERPAPPQVPERIEVPASDVAVLHVYAAVAGAPLALAGHVEPALGADPVLRRRGFATDAAGHAEIRGLLPGPWIVTVDRGAQVRVETTDGATHAEVAVAAAAAREGVVVRVDGSPVEGARIWLSGACADDAGFFAATTDGAGAFRIEHAPAERFVSAFAAGWQPSVLHALASSTPLRLVLDRAAVPVTVAVTGPGGAPVADATVQLGAPPSFPAPDDAEECTARPPWIARTDAQGLAVCAHAAPDQRAWFCVRAPDLPAVQQWVTPAAADQGARVAVELPAGARCQGAVRDAAAATRVTASTAVARPSPGFALPEWCEPVARAAADGAYALTGIAAGEVLLRAGTDDRFAERLWAPAPGAVLEWSPRLGPGGELRGTAATAAGAPLAGCVVLARPPLGRTLRAEVGADGAFRLQGLGEQSYEVTLSEPAQRGGALLARRGDLRAGEVAEFVLAGALVPSAFVRGVLTLPPGAEWPPLTVSLQHFPEAPGHGTPIAADGSFRIGPVVPGRYHWFAATNVHWMHREVEVGIGVEVDLGAIAVEEPLTVELRCAPADPTPPDHAYLWTEDGLAMVSLCDFRDGRGELYTPPGRFVLRTVREGVTLRWQVVELRHRGQRVDVEPVDPAAVPVRVAAVPAEPVRSLMGRWRLTGAGLDRTFSTMRRHGAAPLDPLGFRVWLAPGDYRVEVDSDVGRGELQLRVPVPAGEEPPNIMLRPVGTSGR